MTPSDRYHALDSLRGFAMLLGVVLHAAVSFLQNVPPFWSVRDRNPDPLADVFVFAVHTFRMQLFFLLAGFFGCLLYQRYGPGGMAWHRVKRVLVPFALAVVLVTPTVMGAFLYAELGNARTEGVPDGAPPARKVAAELIAAAPGSSDLALVGGRLTSGEFVRFVPLAHLWFLYYLLWLYPATLALAPVLGRLTGARFLAAFDARFRRVIEGPWRVVVPALVTVPLLLAMHTWTSDTPLSWVPEARILGYYAFFFAFGWVLYRHRDLVPAFGRGWRTSLAVANLLVLPVALVVLFSGIDAEHALARGEPGPAPLVAFRALTFAAQAAYTWLMIIGLWGACLHYFSRERAWVRYLADSAYWCYLASITPIVLLQFWVKDWPLPGLLKWAFVSAAAMALLLLSYELFVRYTFVGATLNGRKTRAKAAVPREA